MSDSMPPLPTGDEQIWTGAVQYYFAYSADQMHAYARAYAEQETAALRIALENARTALADIATSSDMTLTLARKKAHRIYRETATPATSESPRRS